MVVEGDVGVMEKKVDHQWISTYKLLVNVMKLKRNEKCDNIKYHNLSHASIENSFDQLRKNHNAKKDGRLLLERRRE